MVQTDRESSTKPSKSGAAPPEVATAVGGGVAATVLDLQEAAGGLAALRPAAIGAAGRAKGPHAARICEAAGHAL